MSQTGHAPSSQNHNGNFEVGSSSQPSEPPPKQPDSHDNEQNPATRAVPIGQQNPDEPQENVQEVAEDDQEFFKEMRGWLMIIAILAAWSTYQAGLNPPGSVWQEDNNDHHYVAGNPILHDKFFNRYQAFFYCNAISFLSSLVIIIFLMNKTFYRERPRIKVLEITMVLDLFSFMAAYAVGSCRRVTSSIYVFLLMGGVFVYVISFARHYSALRRCVHRMPCVGVCIRARENRMQRPVRFRSEAEA